MVEVQHRNAETLLPLIQQYIRPGSTIASDFWRAYFRIDQLPQGFHHVQVNHSENFVDPRNPDIHRALKAYGRNLRLAIKSDMEHMNRFFQLIWSILYGAGNLMVEM